MMIDVPPSFKRPDGKWEHHIRQSDINTFLKCPEQFHRQLIDSSIKRDGDAAIVGSACHAVYAVYAIQLMSGQDVEGLSYALELGTSTIRALWGEAEENHTLYQMQIENVNVAETMVRTAVHSWFNHVLPILVDNAEYIEGVELSFDLPVQYGDTFVRDIYLTGTMDLKIATSIWDYKHSQSQKYTKGKAWQLSRYDPQATQYVWADTILTGEIPNFSYVNINPSNGDIGFVEVEKRTKGDFGFHLATMNQIASMIESDLKIWPLGASDWWCSPKWCPAWATCRGSYIGDDPWNLMDKVERKLKLV